MAPSPRESPLCCVPSAPHGGQRTLLEAVRDVTMVLQAGRGSSFPGQSVTSQCLPARRVPPADTPGTVLRTSAPVVAAPSPDTGLAFPVVTPVT